jgi:hypothetical protein
VPKARAAATLSSIRKFDLKDVMDTYLPPKAKHGETFLP